MTPDEIIIWQYAFIKLNSTILTTWLIMAVLVVISWLATRDLSPKFATTSWQNMLEVIILFIRKQIEAVGMANPDRYLSFLVTIFIFTAFCAICTILPGYDSPTASLSTTTALAICVFIAVPIFGITETGVSGYLKRYTQPNILMLPFNIITELSRTLALAVRLFGNMTSGGMIVGIIVSIAPLIFPIMLQLLGLLTGLVQAYIFTILSMVYIAAAVSGKEG